MLDPSRTTASQQGGSPPGLSELTPGSIIADTYKVNRCLGGGGMSVVYECEDVRTGMPVAIKFMQQHLTDDDRWIARFKVEAKAIQRLSHPCIIRYHNFVMNETESYIVMDYVAGRSLSEIVETEGSLELARCLRIMDQVADALLHAHSKGIIHRDLKPSNIMLIRTASGNESVRILDFGIAKIVADDEGPNKATQTKMTQTGEVFGSPAYMSPEQSLGKKVDARCDQYSFGCVMFECLTGGPPFMGDNPVDTLVKQINDDPPTLREGSLGKTFSAELETLIRRLLSKEPEGRYPSMAELKAELNRIANPPKATAAAVQRVSKSIDSNKRNFVILGAVLSVALVCSGLGWFIWNVSRAPVQKTVQEKAREAPVVEVDPSEAADNVFARGIARHINEKRVAFSGKVTDAGLEPLFTMPRLRIVQLEDCDLLSDQGVSKLAKLPHIYGLSLKGCSGITSKSIIAFEQVPLGYVDLDETHVDDDAMEALSHIPTLQAVKIGHTAVTDKGIAALAKLPGLKVLELRGLENVTDKGLEPVGKMKSLINLDIGFNRDLGPCLKYFKEVDPIIFELQRTGVHDEDLGPLLGMKRLNTLGLQDTPITDDSFKVLKQLKSVTILDIRNCQHISQAGAEQLAKEMPWCRIRSGFQKDAFDNLRRSASILVE